MAAVHDAVPFDGYCLLGLDPGSGMRSFLFSRQGLDGVAARLAYNETVEADVNRYADLATAAVPVGVLSATGSRPPASPRLHEILRPAGFTSELRLALRSEGRLWGALVLFRGDRRGCFADADADADADVARALARPLRAAVRRYPVRRITEVVASLPAGVVFLDARNAIVGMTDEARAWLADLRAGGLDEITFDDALRVVYDVGLVTRAPARGSPAPVCSLRTSSGRWLHVHGAFVDDAAATVAVVLQPATLQQLLPVVAAWYGLTRREAEVLHLLARGLAAKQMSARLHLSVLTVNDHLKAIYRKADVSGREDLLARLA